MKYLLTFRDFFKHLIFFSTSLVYMILFKYLIISFLQNNICCINFMCLKLNMSFVFVELLKYF